MPMTIFLSYAHQDAPKIDVLSRDLDDLVGSVWLDKSLSGGQLWWDEILRQIRECRLFVLAVSRHSLRSEACLAESAYATALNRPFLSVRVDDADLGAAPTAIRQRQLIDFQSDDVPSIKALARALMHAPAPGPLPATLPAPPPIPLSYRDRFATLFGPAMTMEDQVATFARLKLDIDNDSNAAEALSTVRQFALDVYKIPQADCDQMLDEIGKRTREVAPLFEINLGSAGKSFEDVLKQANEALVDLTLRSQQQATMLEVLNEERKTKATTDGLTGLANRSSFDGALPAQFALARHR